MSIRGLKSVHGRWSVRLMCLLAAVVTLWPLLAGHQWPAVIPSLSPFVGTATLLATGTLSALGWLGLIVGLIAVLRHRWFCRWICPTGLCADCASHLGRRLRRPHAAVPSLGQWIAAATLGGACLGYPLFLWMDPLGIFTSLFRWTEPDTATDPLVWCSAGFLLAVLLLSFVWPNAWCGQICPLGAMQDLLAFVPRLRHVFQRPGDADPQPLRGGRVARRTVLAAVLGGSLTSMIRIVRGETTELPLRPPGALAGLEFLGLCLRCGNCSRVCPTQIIRADGLDHGMAGLLAPIIRFSDGYCREDCVRCTEACPSGALTRLTLQEKQQVSLGEPAVDMNICLLGDDRECAACRNHCPYEAIRYVFSEVEYTLTPEIDSTRCNGCGACQVACPTTPTKAIVVMPGGQPA